MVYPGLQSKINEVQDILDYLAAIRDGKLDGGDDPPPDTLVPPYVIKSPVGMSIWGLNWDGSDDSGDIDKETGKPLPGAFGDNNHNAEIVGISLPIKVFTETIGAKANRAKFRAEVYSLVTQKTVTGIEFTDLGPAAKLHRPADGTYGLHKTLGHLDYGHAKWGTNYSRWPEGFQVAVWIEDLQGQCAEIKGWDFKRNRVIGS